MSIRRGFRGLFLILLAWADHLVKGDGGDLVELGCLYFCGFLPEFEDVNVFRLESFMYFYA